ncbi:hypothetical protein AYI70_g2903 [Smittium culicis]|uniref:Uncharacterized protein n=1 Tax=Smittium culicis TaxID=133412 RepID=A0A1R1Y660_9FUNG|nr:hypothetical protein AYI70_g2903 [Smittium culicis]
MDMKTFLGYETLPESHLRVIHLETRELSEKTSRTDGIDFLRSSLCEDIKHIRGLRRGNICLENGNRLEIYYSCMTQLLFIPYLQNYFTNNRESEAGANNNKNCYPTLENRNMVPYPLEDVDVTASVVTGDSK